MKNVKNFFVVFHKYVKSYKFNSIFVKNLTAMVVLVIIPIISIVIISYITYYNIQQKEVRIYNQSYINNISRDFERLIKECKDQLDFIAYNNDVELFILSYKETNEFFFNLNSVINLVAMPINSKAYINSVYIYAGFSDRVITVKGICNYKDLSDKSSIEEYLNNEPPASKVWIAITEYPKENSTEKQLSIYKSIRFGSQKNGMVVMNVNVELLEKSLGISQSDNIYIVNDDRIIYSTTHSLIGHTINEIEDYYNLTVNKSINYNGVNVELVEFEDSGFSYIAKFDTQIYKDRLKNIRFLMAVLVSSIIILIFFLCFYISIQMLNPIGIILSTIEDSKATIVGEDDVLAEENELKYIVSSIQKTISENKNIEDELTKRLAILKKAQSIALQSQINPHFLNNTLETVNLTAVGILGNENKISMMVGALSNILRLTLQNTDTIIPFQNEVDNAKMYLEIQKMRYVDKFDIVWEIEDDVMMCKTVKIIIQPIIENAIYHGLKYLSVRGKIKISGEIADGTVCITIEDNGLGMTKEEVTRLNYIMMNDDIKESSHIGIANVNQRLKLYFGDSYGVAIESVEGFGTKVFLRFPYIK